MATEVDDGADVAQQKQIEQIVGSLLNHIFGAGEEAIKEQLRSAENLPQQVGQITFVLISEAKRQADEAGMPLEMDTMLAAGTEIIDALFELADAMGLAKKDDQDAKDEALAAASQAYMMTAETGEDERAAAQMDLQQMMEDGSVDEAANYLRSRGKQMGVNPLGPPSAGLMGG